MNYDLLTILGPTACGKTTFACHLARQLGNAEIISADSRMVYRGMTIGTGKDLSDYHIDGVDIPYHLIDILPAGYRFNVSASSSREPTAKPPAPESRKSCTPHLSKRLPFHGPM